MGHAWIAAVLASLGQSDPPARAEVRRALDAILASGEYETGQPRRVFSIFNWVLEQFRKLVDLMTDLGVNAPILFWIILVLCVSVLALIFTHAGIVLFRSLRAARADAPGARDGRVRRHEDPRALLERAQAEASRGALDEAVRLCHRAALLGLDRRGVVRFRESLTTGDYAAQLRNHPAERDRFREISRVYEPAFFGRFPVAPKQCSECLRLAGALVREGTA